MVKEANIAVTIPMNGIYPSLNLSQAVMVVAYELAAATTPGVEFRSGYNPATNDHTGDPDLPPDADVSWKVLESRIRFLLETAGIPEGGPLFHRILERLSYLREGDIHLAHSVSSRLQKIIAEYQRSSR